jgi:hypothetical protein
LRPTNEDPEGRCTTIELHRYNAAPSVVENNLEALRDLAIGVDAEPRVLGVMRKQRMGKEEDREIEGEEHQHRAHAPE